MKVIKIIFLFIIWFNLFCTYAQNEIDSLFVDKNYLEDQIYLGITYNILTNKPTNFTQNGLSGGVSIGFIKDIPMNESRNKGFGIGLGYAYNAYIQNLKITNTTYEVVDNVNFNSNRFSTHVIEMPIEYRWRTSTATKYNFWRIYAGFKLGYVFGSNAKYTDTNQLIKLKEIETLQKFQYGLTLNTGFNTFNLSIYYGLNSLFKNVEIENHKVDLKQLNVGLKFYIL